MANNFWQIKKLNEFTNDEWEQICCNCGLCCLVKLQNEDDDEIYYTRIICHLFDCKTRLCKEYTNRCKLIPECLKITSENIDKLEWMPKKCSYRILNETGDLPEWHPLKNKKKNLPDLPNNLITDNMVNEESLEDYIVEDDAF